MNLTKINDTVYTLTETKGAEEAKIILFYLFPGIILGINYVNMRHITGNASQAQEMDFLRINYCFEGRYEVKLKDGRYVYVDNDVLCIEDHTPQYNFYYPLGFYRGIEVYIDKKQLACKNWEVFDLFGINPAKIIKQYGDTEKTFIHNASDLFAEISTDMVSVWENEVLSLEDKVCQLRLSLCRLFSCIIKEHAVNHDSTYQASSLSYSQYMIAIDCEKRITTDLSQKQTIAALAEDYKISPSSLKKFFSHVYGCSISEYLQTMRMKEAIRLLTEENLSIMQIAATVGYENQSKFSAVFKKHTGYAPLEYKRINILKKYPPGIPSCHEKHGQIKEKRKKHENNSTFRTVKLR